MNTRIDYKFKAVVLRLLLLIAEKLLCADTRPREVQDLIEECEAISDGRQNV